MPTAKPKTKNLKPKMQIKKAVKPVAKTAIKKTAPKKVKAEIVEMPKETPTRKASASVAGGGLKQSIYDTKGKVVESISLSKDIFGAKINKHLMAQAVRVFLSNNRKGTVKTKSRGEVNKTTKKVYRQKGTGRARHGAMSAPIYVGGGVAFGPRPRDYSLSFPQKMKRAALFSALSAKVKDGEIKILTGLEKIEPKTKLMADVIENLDLKRKNLPAGKSGKKILLISTGAENVKKAGRNIKGLTVLDARLLNTYEVLDNKGIILMKGALEVIENNFLKKVN